MVVWRVASVDKFVCQSVCLSVTRLRPAKTTLRIDVLYSVENSGAQETLS